MITQSDLSFDADISGLSASQAVLWGFHNSKSGTHTSRTIMLRELSHLLEIVPPDAKRKAYANAIVVDNCLGKRTVTTRRKSLQHLSHMYALDPGAILFRVLRDLWKHDKESRPLLAILLALARDSLLRSTFAAVACTPYGKELNQPTLKAYLVDTLGDYLNATTLSAATSRLASSWTQSGHLRGHLRRTRQKIEPTPTAATYALLLGFAMGQRGQLLFETPWVAILDSSREALLDLAFEAKRLGLLELKQSGALIDVTFSCLLTKEEMRKLHGTH